MLSERFSSERCILALILVSLGIGAMLAIKSFNSLKYSEVQNASTKSIVGDLLNPVTKHEPVHIVQICHNGDSIRRLTTFLKSLLYYRSCPIVLHILTNFQTSITIRELFRTWKLRNVEIKTYIRENEEKELDWIWYVHLAGPYALKKLIIEKILPEDVERVIFYDADIVMLDDIYDLWNLMNSWGPSQVIGLAPETQAWYTDHHLLKVWPSIDVGYNTGLIMYDLKKLRTMDWPGMWKPIAKRELEKRGYAMLPEQDILNTCFVDHPEILFKIPCIWNMQFGGRVRRETCPYDYEYKALHTTVAKISETHDGVISSLAMYKELVLQFDLLRGERFTASDSNKHRLFPYFYDFELEPLFDQEDVSLVLHMTFEELDIFKQVAESWPGPMSVAIFGDEKDILKSHQLPRTGVIAYHFVYKKTSNDMIPVKLLQDVAIKYAPTSHILLGKLGHKVNVGGYAALRDMVKTGINFISLPVFQSKCVLLTELETKGDLLLEMSRGIVTEASYSNTEIIQKWQLAKSSFVAKWGSEHNFFVVMPTLLHPIFSKQNRNREIEEVDYKNDFLVGRDVLVTTESFSLKQRTVKETLWSKDFTIQC